MKNRRTIFAKNIYKFKVFGGANGSKIGIFYNDESYIGEQHFVSHLELKQFFWEMFVIPKSAIMQNEKKISYFDFLKSGQNEDCTKALKEVTKRIDLDKINTMIAETPLITDVEKTFYKFMLKERKTYILDKALELLEEKVQEKPLS